MFLGKSVIWVLFLRGRVQKKSDFLILDLPGLTREQDSWPRPQAAATGPGRAGSGLGPGPDIARVRWHQRSLGPPQPDPSRKSVIETPLAKFPSLTSCPKVQKEFKNLQNRPKSDLLPSSHSISQGIPRNPSLLSAYAGPYVAKQAPSNQLSLNHCCIQLLP